MKENKLQHFPSVQRILQENETAAWLLDLSKYCDCLRKLGWEFDDRFLDFELLESCASFIVNPFMEVGVTDMSEKLASLFKLCAVGLELKILNLQNDIQLKAKLETSGPREIQKHSNCCKVYCLFGSRYRCESAFSNMNYIKLLRSL